MDIVLIEPSPKDYQMSFSNIMRYSTRLTLARHGFETVTLKLAENYDLYSTLLSRHDIAITQRLVAEELEAIRTSGNKPSVIRRILERHPTSNKRLPAATTAAAFTNLSATLDELDDILRDWPAQQTTGAQRGEFIGARAPARSHE